MREHLSHMGNRCRLSAFFHAEICRTKQFAKTRVNDGVLRGLLDRLSRPVWARGLKFVDKPKAKAKESVAPRVGAWIEIAISA